MGSERQHTSPPEHPVVKHARAEFLVRESLIVPLIQSPGGPYTYLELRKSGLTTFEAVGRVARHFALPPGGVRFAGLKDEDGISEQLISLECSVSSAALERFNAENRHSGDDFVSLRYYGTGDEPLRPGGLSGNAFRLRIRNLSTGAVARLATASRYDFYFLNYYDLQRFGVAGGPRTTHRIGEALIAGDHARALDLVRMARTRESEGARHHVGPPEEFFASLDPRVTSFFKSSYSSSVWNERLRAAVTAISESVTSEEWGDGLKFTFCPHQNDVLALLTREPTLEYQKYYGSEGSAGTAGMRSTVVQAQIHYHDSGPDETYPNAHWCDVSFFLPSGAYATMCVRQLANTVDLALPASGAFSSHHDSDHPGPA